MRSWPIRTVWAAGILRPTRTKVAHGSISTCKTITSFHPWKRCRCWPKTGSSTRMIDKLAGLTARERDVVLLVCEGLGNQEIADRLGRCVGTVKSVNTAYRKLGVISRAQLAVMLMSDWR